MNLEKIRNQILNENKLVKEIDFEKDIDVFKSGKYLIGKRRKDVQLMYHSVFKPELKDFLVSYGVAEKQNGGFKLMPQLKQEIIDSPYRMSMYLDRPVDTKKGIVHFSMERSVGSCLYFRFCNSYIMSLYENLKSSKSIQNKNAFEDVNAKSIDYIFKGNQLIIIKRCGMQSFYDDAISISLDGLCNNLLVNYEEDYVLIDNQKFHIPFKGFLYGIEAGINIFGMCGEIMSADAIAYLTEVNYGKSEGYIYFNPIKVTIKAAQTFMLFRGNPLLQFYDASKDLWVDVKCQSNVKIEESIQLRVRLKSSDKIYNIFLAEKNI